MASWSDVAESLTPRRRRMITFRRWQRHWLWWMVYLCIGSGVALFVIRRYVEKEDMFSLYNHPSEPWIIALHLITSPILIYVVGSLMVLHIIPHFRQRLHFWSGNLLLATFGVYSVTGMFLFFLFPEPVVEATKWVHTVSGVVFFPILAYHWWIRHRAQPAGRRR